MSRTKEIQRIFLTGYMGSGKSLLGKSLAQELAWQYMDTDDMIVDAEKHTVSEIFKSKGEAYFRSLEFKIIKELTNTLKPQVISLGGGAFIQDEIRDFLLKDEKSIIVYLKYDAAILAERLKTEQKKRPLIADAENLQQFIEKHLTQREPFYQMADLIIRSEENQILIINQILSYLIYKNQN